MRAYISVTEAAEILGVSRRTVWESVRSGEIEGARIRRKWLIKKDAIDRLTNPKL